jgi:hypothetical protein
MSCLWIEAVAGEWVPHTVPPGRPVAGEDLGVPGIALLVLPRQGAVLLARDGVWVRVNGEPVPGGMRILEHADEVLVEDVRLVFSQQGAPVVVTFTAAEGQRLPTCPVCRGPVRAGMQAVQCPGCGRWFHQHEGEGQPARPCWTYAAACRFCQHPTAFDAEAAWRPDREENLAR